jgi:hypothetical protein
MGDYFKVPDSKSFRKLKNFCIEKKNPALIARNPVT